MSCIHFIPYLSTIQKCRDYGHFERLIKLPVGGSVAKIVATFRIHSHVCFCTNLEEMCFGFLINWYKLSWKRFPKSNMRLVPIAIYLVFIKLTTFVHVWFHKTHAQNTVHGNLLHWLQWFEVCVVNYLSCFSHLFDDSDGFVWNDNDFLNSIESHFTFVECGLWIVETKVLPK